MTLQIIRHPMIWRWFTWTLRCERRVEFPSPFPLPKTLKITTFVKVEKKIQKLYKFPSIFKVDDELYSCGFGDIDNFKNRTRRLRCTTLRVVPALECSSSVPIPNTICTNNFDSKNVCGGLNQFCTHFFLLTMLFRRRHRFSSLHQFLREPSSRWRHLILSWLATKCTLRRWSLCCFDAARKLCRLFGRPESPRNERCMKKFNENNFSLG